MCLHDHTSEDAPSGQTRTVTMDRRQLVQGLAAGTVVAFAGGMAGCAYNESLGRQQLMLVDQGQIAQLSASAWQDVLKQEKRWANPAANRRVETVGKRITTAAGRTDLEWEYAVFDDDQLNAFVLPSGKVGVYRGLLETVKNDDQLAAVLGHETGHVSARHAAERYSQQVAAGVGGTVAQVAVAQSDTKYKNEIVQALGLGVTFGVLLPYSRKHELEADRIGVDYMHRAGYKPMEAVELWKLMQAQGGNKPPEFMSTHPAEGTRIRELEQHILRMGYA